MNHLVPHCSACTALVPLAQRENVEPPPEPTYCGYCGAAYYEGPYADLCPRCADCEEGLAELATPRST